MNSIHLQQTLPQVFADRNSVTSDVWHQDPFFRKGEMYLIEAAQAPANLRCAAISMAIATTIRGLLISMKPISKHTP